MFPLAWVDGTLQLPCEASRLRSFISAMSQILFHYHRVHPTTWVYLSSLLMIAVYFKFSRIWSVRNLDLLGLIMLAPGLLLVEYGRVVGGSGTEKLGFVWLFVTGGLFLVRLLCDPLMVRRPLLEPNLSVGGLTFAGISLFVFLMANVLTTSLTQQDLVGSTMVQQVAAGQSVDEADVSLSTHGPGYPPLFLLPHLLTAKIYSEGKDGADRSATPSVGRQHLVHVATTRTMAILAHLAVVVGILVIGYEHFGNIRTGIAAATLYLLLPYTAQYTGQVHHVLPAALLVWAIATYRRPLMAGMFIGLAIGVVYYPAFLLPLWCGFYWQRGLLRFLAGVLLALAALTVALAVMAGFQWDVLLPYLRQMFGLRLPAMENLRGLWQFEEIDPVYRIPVLAAFGALCGSFAIWPAQKNLGTLISCSAAVMLSVQFWHAYGGGLYMAWYLPLLIMAIFRPNLDDRIALSVLGKGWVPPRPFRSRGMEQAA